MLLKKIIAINLPRKFKKRKTQSYVHRILMSIRQRRASSTALTFGYKRAAAEGLIGVPGGTKRKDLAGRMQ